MNNVFKHIDANTFKLKEEDTSNPEERKEVEIGRLILKVIEDYLQEDLHPYHEKGVEKIKALAIELLKLHGVK